MLPRTDNHGQIKYPRLKILDASQLVDGQSVAVRLSGENVTAFQLWDNGMWIDTPAEFDYTLALSSGETDEDGHGRGPSYGLSVRLVNEQDTVLLHHEFSTVLPSATASAQTLRFETATPSLGATVLLDGQDYLTLRQRQQTALLAHQHENAPVGDVGVGLAQLILHLPESLPLVAYLQPAPVKSLHEIPGVGIADFPERHDQAAAARHPKGPLQAVHPLSAFNAALRRTAGRQHHQFSTKQIQGRDFRSG